MEYPIFEFPMAGGSLLIAAIAIFHVYLAQFSIGAAVLVALAEWRANRAGDLETRAFLRKYAFLILAVPYVIGTATGVGIWLAISVVQPRATSILIHQFVWAWASEWVVFIIEVTAIYLYFYTWDRIRPSAHNAIGWVLAAASWLTLPIINAILSFMLTPGGWRPRDGWAFWKALFNPLWLPTTGIRTLVALALGGAGAILLLAFAKGVSQATRERISRLAYAMIMPVWLCVPLAVWVYAVLPARAQGYILGGAAVMQLFFFFGAALFIALAASAVVAMARRDYTASPSRAVLVALVAFVAYGSFEFVRECIRKPYIIDGFMFSTGVTTALADGIDRRATYERVRRDGVLTAAPWAVPEGKSPGDLAPEEKGRAVYAAACRACHTLDGYNALRPVVRGWSEANLLYMVDHANQMRPVMPPFPGTQDEKEALVAYLASINSSSPCAAGFQPSPASTEGGLRRSWLAEQGRRGP